MLWDISLTVDFHRPQSKKIWNPLGLKTRVQVIFYRVRDSRMDTRLFDRLLKQRTERRESIYFVRYTNEKKSEALRGEREYEDEEGKREIGRSEAQARLLFSRYCWDHLESSTNTRCTSHDSLWKHDCHCCRVISLVPGHCPSRAPIASRFDNSLRRRFNRDARQSREKRRVRVKKSAESEKCNLIGKRVSAMAIFHWKRRIFLGEFRR